MTDTHATATETAAPALPFLLIKPLAITGLIVYFIFLVLARAPASIAAWAAHQSLPALWMTGVHGTLWNGRAGGAQIDIGNQTFALGELRWQLNPWTLLGLQACLEFDATAPGQQLAGTACQSLFGTTNITELTVDMPVNTLTPLLPTAAVGQLSLHVVRAEIYQRQIMALDARISWQNGSISLGDRWLSLGSFAAQAKEHGEGGIKAKLFELSGPIGTDLLATWFPGAQNWSVEGVIAPEPSAPPQVREGLKIFAEELEPGKFKVIWPL